MSRHYRHEKDCLNCGAIVNGKFCSECGQENLKPKESFSHLFGHFFSHYFHFDSKFWSSIKPLLFKPGFLTLEYSLGRRVSYVNPLNLYFFISVVFFLTAALIPDSRRAANYVITPSGISRIDTFGQTTDSITHQQTYRGRYLRIESDTTDTNEYKTKEEYLHAQSLLPEKKRDGYFERLFSIRYIEMKNDPAKAESSFKEKFIKNVPKLMFIMLPVFALLLHLFYLKKKKYFVENVIFSIHFHSLIFLILLLTIVIEAFILFNISAFSVILFIIYLYFALRRVFQQSRIKTLFKTFGIILVYFILLVIGQGVNMLLSIMMM